MNTFKNIIKNIEYGFDNQLIKSLKGKDYKGREFEFVTYFPTNNAIKFVSLGAKLTIKDFDEAINRFFNLVDVRNIEIVPVYKDENVPLHHLSLVSEKITQEILLEN